MVWNVVDHESVVQKNSKTLQRHQLILEQIIITIIIIIIIIITIFVTKKSNDLSDIISSSCGGI